MKLGITRASAAIAIVLAFSLPAGAGTVLTLDPVGGALAGNPGDTVGWGFTFYNDTNFAVVTSSDYVTRTSVGTYTDLISAEFQVIGPSPESASWTQAYDPRGGTGMGSYLIDALATPGGTSTGVIQITYDLYGVSPNDALFDPGADLLSSGNTISADASIDVTQPEQNPSSVPEPGLGLCAGLAGLGLCAAKRRLTWPR